MKKITTTFASIILLLFLSGQSSLLFAQANGSRLNKAIELLENDEPVFGLLSFDYSLNNARSLARSGLDFIIIDMEHAPFDDVPCAITTNARSVEQRIEEGFRFVTVGLDGGLSTATQETLNKGRNVGGR